MFKEFSPKSQNVISVDMISELPAAWVQVVDGEDGKKKSKQTFNNKKFCNDFAYAFLCKTRSGFSWYPLHFADYWVDLVVSPPSLYG